eukprot:1150050-Pelagomonas_calceolata.AAC.3
MESNHGDNNVSFDVLQLRAVQWAQMYNAPKPRFMKFNYGPEYDLQKIKSPVYYISGEVVHAKNSVQAALCASHEFASQSSAANSSHGQVAR